jgi:N-acetylneuraminic acid mutarotase
MMRLAKAARGVLLVLCAVSLLMWDVADAQTVIWRTLSSAAFEPRYLLGVGVVNGILYAAGGWSGGGAALARVQAYDPATNTWSQKPAPLPSIRAGLGVGVVNGLLYAVGGDNSDLNDAYNPAANTWTARARMQTARYAPGVGVVNGILYAVGGVDPTNARLSSVEAYNPATNTWTPRASMPTARYGLGMGVVNGILYAVGGAVDDALSTVEAYNPATNTWTTRASMPTARHFLGVGVVDGVLYAVGGASNAGIFSTVEAYDPATNTWTSKASMPTARYGLGVGVVGGDLFAIGGHGASGPVSANEAFTVAIQVQIDIRPGVFPNQIALNSPDVLPVAILATSSFNVADVAPETIRFAGAAPRQGELADVDGDGDLDLLLKFPIARLELACGNTAATLTSATKTGVRLIGADSVLIVRDKTGQLCP